MPNGARGTRQSHGSDWGRPCSRKSWAAVTTRTGIDAVSGETLNGWRNA